MPIGSIRRPMSKDAFRKTTHRRRPWLNAIAAWIDATRRVGGHATIACSALKRTYRDILVGDRRDVRIVYLRGERELIAHRMTLRHGHFMPPSLLESQLATLQEPGVDEHPIVVSIDARPHESAATASHEILASL